MEWTMPDGSTFYTQAVYHDGDRGGFWYTSVTALVGGKAFTGRIEIPPDDLEMSDLMTTMSEVPEENIYPRRPTGFLDAPKYDSKLHYLKSPSFEWEDAQRGRTFVADRLLSEASIYELLRSNPHPNLAEYLGCLVENGRIKSLCLRRYERSAADMMDSASLSDEDIERWVLQIVSGVRHLHRLGYAHNDINAYNVCINSNIDAVLIDFDSCERLGEVVLKGSLVDHQALISDECNDWDAIGRLDRELRSMVTMNGTEAVQTMGHSRRESIS